MFLDRWYMQSLSSTPGTDYSISGEKHTEGWMGHLPLLFLLFLEPPGRAKVAGRPSEKEGVCVGYFAFYKTKLLN